MIGRLCQDLELRRTQSGTACCSFRLAVKRPKVKDTTDFLDCVVWQQGAEYLCQYGHKGDIVGVTGYLTTREWQDKEGNKRKAIEVTCDSVELLSSKRSTEGNSNPAPAQNASYTQQVWPNQQAQQTFEPINDPNVVLPF